MDLYEALKNGTSKEDLIKTFTEELNAASHKLQEEEAAKKAKDEALENARFRLIKAVQLYLKCFGVKLSDTELNEIIDEFGDALSTGKHDYHIENPDGKAKADIHVDDNTIIFDFISML